MAETVMRDLTKPCKTFDGYLSRGYGRISTNGKKGQLRHKVAWEAVNGPVPPGLELDHLCMNKACYEVSHLEPVTHQENMRRAAAAGLLGRPLPPACPQGHPYDDENTYVDKTGRHHCRECSRQRVRARREAARHGR